MPARTILIATLSLAAAGACGQTVHRCGSSYSSQPCAGGTAIDVSDPARPAEAKHAAAATAADQKRADAMEKDRLAREKDAPRAVVIGPTEPPAPAARKEPAKDGKKGKKDKAHDPEVFTATSQREAKKTPK